MAEEFWTDERVAVFAQQVAQLVVEQFSQNKSASAAPDDLLNVEQVADLLQLGRDDDDATTPPEIRKSEAVAHLRRTKNFPKPAKIGLRLLWLKSDVLDWYKEERRNQLAKQRKEGKKLVGITAMKQIRKECPEDYPD